MRQVTAAVIIEGGRLFIARRAAGSTLQGFWELPGGKTEDGETPEECLARELAEELAMEVDVGALVASTTWLYEHGSFEMLAMVVRRLTGYELRVHDSAAWVTRSELCDYTLAPADVELVAQLGRARVW